jgi:hypothetical protein
VEAAADFAEITARLEGVPFQKQTPFQNNLPLQNNLPPKQPSCKATSLSK